MKLKAELLFLPLLSVAMRKSSCLPAAPAHAAPRAALAPHRLIHVRVKLAHRTRRLERTIAMIGIYGAGSGSRCVSSAPSDPIANQRRLWRPVRLTLRLDMAFNSAYGPVAHGPWPV